MNPPDKSKVEKLLISAQHTLMSLLTIAGSENAFIYVAYRDRLGTEPRCEFTPFVDYWIDESAVTSGHETSPEVIAHAITCQHVNISDDPLVIKHIDNAVGVNVQGWIVVVGGGDTDNSFNKTTAIILAYILLGLYKES